MLSLPTSRGILHAHAATMCVALSASCYRALISATRSQSHRGSEYHHRGGNTFSTFPLIHCGRLRQTPHLLERAMMLSTLSSSLNKEHSAMRNTIRRQPTTTSQREPRGMLTRLSTLGPCFHAEQYTQHSALLYHEHSKSGQKLRK